MCLQWITTGIYKHQHYTRNMSGRPGLLFQAAQYTLFTILNTFKDTNIYTFTRCVPTKEVFQHMQNFVSTCYMHCLVMLILIDYLLIIVMYRFFYVSFYFPLNKLPLSTDLIGALLFLRSVPMKRCHLIVCKCTSVFVLHL